MLNSINAKKIETGKYSMFSWLREAWDQSNLAFEALEELQHDNSLARLAQGQLRVSEQKVNELLAEAKLEGVRQALVDVEEGFFSLSAQSERFFLARLTIPLRVEKIIFTPYRHRLYLVQAGNVSAHGSTLWQRATAYTVLALLHHILSPNAPIHSLSDPSEGFTVRGPHLEIDLHRIPEARQVLQRQYEILGKQICPLRFVTIDSIRCYPQYFEINSSVNWDDLYTHLREVIF